MLKADDPDVIFVGNGDAIPGVTGTIQRSKDGGKSWQAIKLPVEPNSVVYWFATPGAAQRSRCGEPLWLRLREYRRGRILEETEEGVRRDSHPGGDTD